MSPLLLQLTVAGEEDVIVVRQRTRHVAAELGFDAAAQTRIATATMALARNAVEHAGGGEVELAVDGEPPPPPSELPRQHQELLHTLEELQRRRAELQRRQAELSRLNREREDTNRGVLALYAELDERDFAVKPPDGAWLLARLERLCAPAIDNAPPAGEDTGQGS